MPDQKRNFANIGDVPKHVALPILAAGFDEQVKQVDQKWIYCESHAGYYDYPRNDKEWTDQQKWSIGVLEEEKKLTEYYGEHFCKEIGNIKFGGYPGSIKIIEKNRAEKFNSLVGIHGWDTKQIVVDSYPGKNQLINVKPGDGFDGVSSLREPYEKLVFCDPFWSEPKKPTNPELEDVKGWLRTLDKGEPNKLTNYLHRLEAFLHAKQDPKRTKENILALLGKQDHVILWYKAFRDQEKFFKKEEFRNCFKIDWEYEHYEPEGYWFKERVLKGAGLIIKGIEEEFCVNAYEKIRELKAVFNGKTWMACKYCRREMDNEDQRKEHIKLVHGEDKFKKWDEQWKKNPKTTAEIKLDLKVEFSRRGGNDDWIKHPRP